MDPLALAAIVVVSTVTPPLLFAAYLRSAERHRREPWLGVLRSFLWGGTLGVILAVIAQLALAPYLDGLDPWVSAISIGTVFLAPVTEEVAKGLGLWFVRDEHPEPEDGYVYGGALGLGFAATENLLYVGVALIGGGYEAAAYTAAFRGAVTVALHGAASAIAGGGIWRTKHGAGWGPALGAVLLAILLHATYNAVVSAAAAWTILPAGAGALYAFHRVRARVKALDRAGAPPAG